MSLTFWESLGMAVFHGPPPPGVIATLKRDLGDAQSELKYIAFSVSGAGQIETKIEEIFEIADLARRYSLNQSEFRSACHSFANNRMRPLLEDRRLLGTRKKQKKNSSKLPAPKVGLQLWRKDQRRRGSCRIVELNSESAKVIWLHSGKHTKVSLSNLLNSNLYSGSDPFRSR